MFEPISDHGSNVGKGPVPVGPYSIFREMDGWVFLSGQIGLDPMTGGLVAGGVEREFRQVLDNVEKVLREAGLGWECCVKTTLYLVEMADFSLVNGIYAERFTKPYPSRSTIGVRELPKGARVELEVLARRPGP
ncbi:MAG: Rid family detoxifying hydrolase [Leptospirales bacterium]